MRHDRLKRRGFITLFGGTASAPHAHLRLFYLSPTGIGSSIRTLTNRSRPQLFAREVYRLEPLRLDHSEPSRDQFLDRRCLIYQTVLPDEEFRTGELVRLVEAHAGGQPEGSGVHA